MLKCVAPSRSIVGSLLSNKRKARYLFVGCRVICLLWRALPRRHERDQPFREVAPEECGVFRLASLLLTLPAIHW